MSPKFLSKRRTNYNNETNGAAAIRCDAMSSCDDVTGIISAIQGGSMYFTGEISSSSNNNPAIIVRNNSDIHCSGRKSCAHRTLLNGDDLYCMGYFSCAYVTLIENFNYVWIYAYRGGHWAYNMWG